MAVLSRTRHSGKLTVGPRVSPLASQLSTNATLVRRALDGLDAQTAARRPIENGNSLAFLVAHVVDARAYLLGILGGDASHDWSEAFAAARGIEEMNPVPTPQQLLATFDILSARLESRLEVLDAEALNRPSGESFPTGDETGQMALLHRALGRGSLSGV